MDGYKFRSRYHLRTSGSLFASLQAFQHTSIMISTYESSKVSRGFTLGRTSGTFSLTNFYKLFSKHVGLLQTFFVSKFPKDSSVLGRGTFCPQRNGSRRSRLLGDIASNRSCPNLSWGAEWNWKMMELHALCACNSHDTWYIDMT